MTGTRQERGMTDQTKDRSHVLLATIATAHGIRGEVMVRTYTGDPEAITRYGPLSDASGTRTFKIRSARATPKGVIVRLDGIADRNAAEALRGTDLYVPRAKLPKAKDGEYYHADLVGLEVRDTSGAVIGRVANVSNFGAGDLLDVELTGTKSTDYVPFTNANVPEVNLAEGYVTIIPPEMTGEPEPASGEDDGIDDDGRNDGA